MNKLKQIIILLIIIIAILSNLWSNNNRCIGIFQKQNKYKDNYFYYTKNFDNLIETIHDKWDENYDLIEIEYGNNLWVGIFQKNTDISRNAYSYRDEFSNFYQAIKNRWDEGYHIVNVEYGEGMWFGIFHKSKNITRSGFSFRSNFFSEAETKLKNELPDTFPFINSMVDQILDDDTELFKSMRKAIKKRREQGFILMDIEKGKNKWFGVFNKQKNIEKSRYVASLSFDEFKEKVKHQIYRGFSLYSMEHGKQNNRDIWIAVLHKTNKVEKSDFHYEPVFKDLINNIKYFWDKKYNFISLSY